MNGALLGGGSVVVAALGLWLLWRIAVRVLPDGDPRLVHWVTTGGLVLGALALVILPFVYPLMLSTCLPMGQYMFVWASMFGTVVGGVGFILLIGFCFYLFVMATERVKAVLQDRGIQVDVPEAVQPGTPAFWVLLIMVFVAIGAFVGSQPRPDCEQFGPEEETTDAAIIRAYLEENAPDLTDEFDNIVQHCEDER